MVRAVNSNGLGRYFLQTVISDIEVTVDMKDALHRVARDLSDRGFVSLAYEGDRVKVRLEPDSYKLRAAANLPDNLLYRGVLSDERLAELEKLQSGRRR